MIAPPPNQQYGGRKTALALRVTGHWTREGQHTFLSEANFQNSACDGSELSDQRTKKHLPCSLILSAWCAIRCIAKRHLVDVEASIKVLAISTARRADTTHFPSRLNAFLGSTSCAQTKVTVPFAGSHSPTCRAICARSHSPTLPEFCREG